RDNHANAKTQHRQRPPAGEPVSPIQRDGPRPRSGAGHQDDIQLRALRLLRRPLSARRLFGILIRHTCVAMPKPHSLQPLAHVLATDATLATWHARALAEAELTCAVRPHLPRALADHV